MNAFSVLYFIYIYIYIYIYEIYFVIVQTRKHFAVVDLIFAWKYTNSANLQFRAFPKYTCLS